MSTLTALVLDGPCAGTYDVARATKRMVFTRAVDGRCYALDEDGDKVEAGEQPFIYETDGSVGWICGRGPCGRTVTFTIAATMDPATGEIKPLTPAELKAERKAARKRVIAWATGERAPVGERSAAAAAPRGPAQEALFLVIGKALYHVPRSQVWEGSRSRQAGKVHLHVVEAMVRGRLQRRAGAALCGRDGWYERPPDGDEELCPRCVDLGRRHGVEWPADALQLAVDRNGGGS